jgi:two-component system, cell cycle sensor histidine kinase and response regulator CckA
MPPVAHGHVLLVDDEPLIRETLRPMLEAFGYAVTEAGSGAEALHRGATMSVDVLITDIRMPGMDGNELAAMFELQRPGTPVLFMSGYTEERPSLGPTRRFIAKPFTMEALITNVDRLLRGRAAS